MYIRLNVSRRHGRVLTDEQSPLRIHCNLDWLGAKGRRPTPPVPTGAGLVRCSDLRSGPLPRLRWPHALCTMPCPSLAWAAWQAMDEIERCPSSGAWGQDNHTCVGAGRASASATRTLKKSIKSRLAASEMRAPATLF